MATSGRLTRWGDGFLVTQTNLEITVRSGLKTKNVTVFSATKQTGVNQKPIVNVIFSEITVQRASGQTEFIRDGSGSETLAFLCSVYFTF